MQRLKWINLTNFKFFYGNDEKNKTQVVIIILKGSQVFKYRVV